MSERNGPPPFGKDSRIQWIPWTLDPRIALLGPASDPRIQRIAWTPDPRITLLKPAEDPRITRIVGPVDAAEAAAALLARSLPRAPNSSGAAAGVPAFYVVEDGRLATPDAIARRFDALATTPASPALAG